MVVRFWFIFRFFVWCKKYLNLVGARVQLLEKERTWASMRHFVLLHTINYQHSFIPAVVSCLLTRFFASWYQIGTSGLASNVVIQRGMGLGTQHIYCNMGTSSATNKHGRVSAPVYTRHETRWQTLGRGQTKYLEDTLLSYCSSP